MAETDPDARPEILVRRAADDELERVASLLEANGLPRLPHFQPLANVLVALRDEAVIGVIVLQVSGLRGLVWRDAVDASEGDGEIRASLFQTLLARAHELSLKELYVVAEADASGFREEGFTPISDDDVPRPIRSTRELAHLRTETSVVMRLELVSRAM